MTDKDIFSCDIHMCHIQRITNGNTRFLFLGTIKLEDLEEREPSKDGTAYLFLRVNA